MPLPKISIQWCFVDQARRTYLAPNRLVGDDELRRHFYLNWTTLPYNKFDTIKQVDLDLDELSGEVVTELDILLVCDFFRAVAEFCHNYDIRWPTPERIALSAETIGLYMVCRNTGIICRNHHIDTKEDARRLLDLIGKPKTDAMLLRLLEEIPRPTSWGSFATAYC